MKIKKIISVIAAAVLLSSVNAAAAFADVEKNDIKVDINGSYIEFDEDTGIPYIDENRRTMVPLRAAMEALACSVEWNGATRSAVITKDDTTVDVPVGEKFITRNGSRIETDTEAVLKNDRIYLPLRAVAESIGAEVTWNQKTHTVIAETQDSDIEQVFVHFIDVGHGDSVLIDCGETEVLIDAGLTSRGAIVSEYIKPYVEGSLDLVIATHGHQDHIGGMPEIFKDYKVDRVIESGSEVDSDYYREYRAAVNAERGCKVSQDCDETIMLGENVSLQIIEVMDGDEIENNNSVTALLTVGQVRVLFTGDSQTEAEEVLASRLEEGEYGKIDVFKSGHHGSRNANSQQLLDTVNPDYIVISAGKGVGYYHPHITALRRMLNTEAIVYGTFLSGNVVMKTDGLSYSFMGDLTPLKITDAGTYQNHIE